MVKGRDSGNIKVSVVVITKNEESNMEKLLASVAWADEIIIVDSGSGDKTVEMARKSGAKVFERKWEGYVSQKNWANARARGEWILSIDADERVTPELKQEIVRTVADVTGDGLCDGYYIPRQAKFLGRWIRHCHWYPDWQMRLFKRDRGTWVGNKVHEYCEVNGAKGHLKNPLLHYTYSGIEDQADRLNHYSSLWAEAAYKQGRKVGILSLLFAPLFTFLNIYFVRLGFLDGFPGLVISKARAYYSFQKKAKLRELYRENKNDS